MGDAVTKHSSAKVTMVAGVPTVLSSDTSGIAAAVAAAKEADEVILAMGTDLTWAHEEHDADNITFTAAQAQLIKEVSAAAKKPVILVMYTATPLDLTEQVANAKVRTTLMLLLLALMQMLMLVLTLFLSLSKIGAILHVGQPSVTVLGVGELLFGKVSPAGRTVQTVLPKAYADMVSIFDFNMRPGPSLFP